MRTLQFSVSGQKLSTAGDHSGLIAGTRGYLQTAYNFDSELNGAMLEHRKNTSMICVNAVERTYFTAKTKTWNQGLLRLLSHQTVHYMLVLEVMPM